MRLRQTIGIGIATAYLVFLTAVYFYIPFGDPGYEYGGLRLILYTLPRGLIGQFVGLVGAVAPNQIGEAVSFFVFVALCGGANMASWPVCQPLGLAAEGLTRLANSAKAIGSSGCIFATASA